MNYICATLLLLAVKVDGRKKEIRGRLTDTRYLTQIDISSICGKGKNQYRCNKNLCLKKVCGDKRQCIAGYRLSDSACHEIDLTPRLILILHPDRIVKRGTGYIIMIIYKGKIKSILRPIIFWLLDDLSRGINLGSAQQRLDISVHAMSWSTCGPRGCGKRKFAYHENDLKSQLNYVELFQNNRWLLRWSQAFTISLWVKTEGDGQMAIFDNDNSVLRGEGMDFWFWCDTSQLAISENGRADGPTILTKSTNEDRYKWRHIAATYTGDPNSVKFFRNGREWPQENHLRMKPKDSKYLILLTKRPSSSKFRFIGAVACISVFQASLSSDEIRTVMNNCP